MADAIDRKIKREVEAIARPKTAKRGPRDASSVRETVTIRKVTRILKNADRKNRHK